MRPRGATIPLLTLLALLLAGPALASPKPFEDGERWLRPPATTGPGWSQAQLEEFHGICRRHEPVLLCWCWIDLLETRFGSLREFLRQVGRARERPLEFELRRCNLRHG